MSTYASEEDCKSELGKQIQRYRADRPDEWTMDEFIRGAEAMQTENERLNVQLEIIQGSHVQVRVTWLENTCKEYNDRLKVLQDAANDDIDLAVAVYENNGGAFDALWGGEK